MMRLLSLVLLLTCPSLLTARETDDRYIVERCMQSLADFTQYATSISREPQSHPPQ